MYDSPLAVFGDLQPYYGDLHNHCDLSYGHGTLAEALANARLQLDFASVTVHAAWPDLPTNDPALNYLVAYHREGFERARQNWPDYLARMEAANQDGRFVTFPSFEWHSNRYGDYCVYYKRADGDEIIDAPDLETLRQALNQSEVPTLLIPHHIGYKQGMRGIDWGAFSDSLSPVVEIFSFHGLSESSEGPYPYMHSMGPRHEQSTAQYGWEQGHVFGVIGSTDHHNAMPGSYGYGRLAVWAEALTRDAIWQAIAQRRTYALSGDRIELAFAVNDTLMGSIAPTSREREIAVAVRGGATLDYIDVLYKNQLIHRETVYPSRSTTGTFKLYIEAGWGEQAQPFAWDITLAVEHGRLHNIEPRFRGIGPTAEPSADTPFAYTTLERSTENRIHFQTQTRPNLSLHTAATEGVAVEIEGDASTLLALTINGQSHSYHLADLLTGSRTIYTGGFVSPAVCLHRAVPQAEFAHQFTFAHTAPGTTRDWYTIRVRQNNNQWAWSSPVWIAGRLA